MMTLCRNDETNFEIAFGESSFSVATKILDMELERTRK